MKSLDRILVCCGGILLLLIAISSVRLLNHYPGTRTELGRIKRIHLDEATRLRMRSLGHEVLVTYYVSERRHLPSSMRRMEDDMADLFESLKRESHDKLAYQIVHPENQADFAAFSAHQQVAPFRTRTVTRDSYQEQTIWSSLHIAYGPYAPAVLNGISPAHLPRLQTILTEQLNYLERPRQPVFTIAAPAGYEELKKALESRGSVSSISLERGEEIPASTDVLFWIDPVPVVPIVLARLNRLLDSGKSIVVAGSTHHVTLDNGNSGPTFAFQPGKYGAESLLGTFGVRLRTEFVLDSVCRQISVGESPHPVRFLIRSIAPNQDFRAMSSLPNGDLLFVAPSPLDWDGEALAKRGWNPTVLATTSDGTTVRPMKYGEFKLGGPELEPGEAAPKLPLMIWLRPNEPWRGSLVVAAASTPFQDGFFQADGFAHLRLLQVLCNTLASDERLVLQRAGVQLSEPLPELNRQQRILWRVICVFLLPVALAATAWKRGVFHFERLTNAERDRVRMGLFWRVAVVLAVILIITAAARAVGWQTDLSQGHVNELSAGARTIAKNRAGDFAARVIVSRPENMPPELRPKVRQLRAMLENFRRSGAFMKVSWIHSEDIDPQQRQQLAESGIRPMRLVTSDEGVTTVREVHCALEISSGNRTELLSFPSSGSFEGLEFRLAFALWRIQNGRRPHVAFVSDVPRLSPAEALEDFQKKNLLAPSGTDVYSLARSALEQAGFRITHINPAAPKVPGDADVIVWMQPRRNIRPLLDQVVKFLHEGKPVMIAAQHFNIQARQYKGAGFNMVYWPQPQVPDIDQYYFPNLGIELVREVLFDDLKAVAKLSTQVNLSSEQREYVEQISALPFFIRTAAANYVNDDLMTRGLGDQLFPFPNFIRWDTNRLAALGLTAKTLIATSGRTWSFPWKGGWLPRETLDGPSAAPSSNARWLGPLPLAVLVEGRFPLSEKPFSEQMEDPGLATQTPTTSETPGRLLLIGCSHLFRNERFADPQFRADHLLLNGVARLALNNDLADIAGHRLVMHGFGYVAPEDRIRWRAIVLAALPAAMLAFGCAWRIIRKRPSILGKHPFDNPPAKRITP